MNQADAQCADCGLCNAYATDFHFQLYYNKIFYVIDKSVNKYLHHSLFIA